MGGNYHTRHGREKRRFSLEILNNLWVQIICTCDERHSAWAGQSGKLSSGDVMSTAIIAKPLSRPRRLELVTKSKRKDYAEAAPQHQSPLAPVFVMIFIAFILSMGMVGTIVMWIALRHSGALPVGR